MSHSIEIRSYRATDDEELMALWSEVLPHPEPHNDSATSLTNRFAVDDLIMVARRGDRLVGAVMGGYCLFRPGLSR